MSLRLVEPTPEPAPPPPGDDARITVSFLPTLTSTIVQEEIITLGDLAQRISETSAEDMNGLPLLKLGRFGTVRTEKGSLRSNDNFIAISGVEGDYDDGLIAISTAVATLKHAGLCGIIYTTRRHEDARPRWRVLCPLSKEYPPAERERFLNRLNGVFGGVFAPESWVLSQCYFYGAWKNNPAHHVYLIVAGGCYLDQADHLDAGAIGKPGGGKPKPAGNGPVNAAPAGDIDLEEIKGALSAVPSDDRKVWIDVGMGLYHATNGSDEARDVWDAWSQTSDKYPGVEDIRKRWDGFKTSRNDTLGAGTVYHYAKQHGWERSSPSTNGAEFEVLDGDEEADKPKGSFSSASQPGDGAPPPGTGNGATAAPAPRPEKPWPKLDDKALHGIPGLIVRELAPRTEADPAALLIHLLAAFGNAIGRIPYYLVNRSRHHTNLYALVVGETSRGRKGMAADDILEFFRIADPAWRQYRVHSGLSSGEGLTYQVRDARIKWDKKKQQDRIEDNGARDKRLLIMETEFGSALTAMSREGNRLSANMRNGWDGKPLEDLVKTNHTRATEHLITIIGHITERELRELLAQNSIYNGFANRFLYILSRRAQRLPFGGSLTDQMIDACGNAIQAALYAARQITEVAMEDRAKRVWEKLYHGEWDTPVPGLLDDVIQRAPPQTARLATIYALFDKQPVILLEHLEAAIAVWNYSRASAARIFGDLSGNPVADDLLRAARDAGAAGLSRTQMSEVLGRNISATRIGLALTRLEEQGMLVKRSGVDARGRVQERWYAV
jgi:hypothetical protein